ncbi:hypothetical protein [Microvirga pakistanensis]|uniref:hypothetical protein n=1 Tax=Microvirga pakistanensis TaxID=1682650 RepID=UPI0018763559|nr:hypothetical protein [Microvirga pakistanensis]
MDESFSRVGLLYGMAFVLAVSKACTLLIWRTLPKPRPPLRQELLELWRSRGTRERVRKASAVPQTPDGIRHENSCAPSAPASDESPNETMKPKAWS